MKLSLISTVCAAALCVPAISISSENERALETRTTQEQITGGELSLKEIRFRGMKLFTTPFTKADGFGDGPAAFNAADRHKNGGRTSLQGNGTFLRINGLDSQTCLECHSVLSRASIPMTFGIGGVGNINNTVLGGGGATFVNANDDIGQINNPGSLGTTGANNINGRTINPPFVFGSGGVELAGNEMTTDLQALAASIAGTANASVALVTKGISFGTLTTDGDGNFVTGAVEGIDSNASSSTFLVVQPFGRRGNNITTRTFDLDAMQFHMGMQPVELFDVPDSDGDGVSDEVLIGEMSALNIFSATLERPFQSKVRGKAREGRQLFSDNGCVECHTPALQTNSRSLGVRFPEIAQNPSDKVYLNIDLSKKPTKFKKNNQGGIEVALFADLKRHSMGTSLAEFDGNTFFTTARLWGVADTAPYLHDGRALTLKSAITLHGADGSEAKPAVDNFLASSDEQQHALLAFLGTLKTPKNPAKDLLKLVNKDDDDDDDHKHGRKHDDD